MPILKAENLSFCYNGRNENVLNNVSFEISEGDFVLIAGGTGSGKSTLLKLIKKQLSPNGVKSGGIFYNGTEVMELDDLTAAKDIGFVTQNPDNQIVTDKVWHELAFGLEGLNVPPESIKIRIAEISGFFGINSLYRRETASLSGGQKQLVNLASCLVMQSKILVLDEPTSQLDPIAASEFIASLSKINRELGITILIVEHRLEELFSVADKVMILEKGKLKYFDSPRQVGSFLTLDQNADRMFLGLPSPVRLFSRLKKEGQCPINVKEGKDFISSLKLRKSECKAENTLSEKNDSSEEKETVIKARDIFFRYEKNSPDVLSGLSLDVKRNELLCILGGNGAGKSTLLKVLTGIRKEYSGFVKIFNKKIKEYDSKELYGGTVAFLPQNPQMIFSFETVLEELSYTLKRENLPGGEIEKRVNEIAKLLEITDILKSHPYDISGGQQQKTAIGKMLLLKPKIILMDEPTKGLDAFSKNTLAELIKKLKADGITIVMVTHDVEFAAENADRCGMFFDGQIFSVAAPIEFFSENKFFTTSVNRMARHVFPKAISLDGLINLIENAAKLEG